MQMMLIKEFNNALSTLTVFPLRGKPHATEARPGLLFFPLIGFLLGLLCWLIYTLVIPFLPGRASYLFLIFLPEFLSRGVHLEHFFAGPQEGSTKMHGLEFLIVFAILMMKFELIQILTLPSQAFLLALTISRWSIVASHYFLPFMKKTSMMKRDFMIATTTVFLVILFFGWVGLFAILVPLSFLCFLWVVASRLPVHHRNKCINSAAELSELLVYISMVLII